MGSNGSKRFLMGILAAMAVGFGSSVAHAQTKAKVAPAPVPAPVPEPPMLCLDCGMLPAPPVIPIPVPDPICLDCGMLPTHPALPMFPQPICLDCGVTFPTPIAIGPVIPKKKHKVVPLPLWPYVYHPFVPACSDCKTGSIPVHPPIAFFGPLLPTKPHIYVVPPKPAKLPVLMAAADPKQASIGDTFFAVVAPTTGPQAGMNVTRFDETRPFAQSAVKTARDAGPSNAGFHH